MGKRERVRARSLKKERLKRRSNKERSRPDPLVSDHDGDTGASPASRRNTNYRAGSRILIVGDGDFSFTRGLAREVTADITATSYDSEAEVRAKYPQARMYLQQSVALGVAIQHGVDARRLDRHVAPGERFDYIIFNFPHSGQQRVHVNRALLRDFCSSARAFLTPKGEIHITLKMHAPYTGWDVAGQAAAAGGLAPGRHRAFDAPAGYQHHTTDPNAKTFQARSARTWVFVRSDDARPAVRIEADRGSGSDDLECGDDDADLGGLLFPVADVRGGGQEQESRKRHRRKMRQSTGSEPSGDSGPVSVKPNVKRKRSASVEPSGDLEPAIAVQDSSAGVEGRRRKRKAIESVWIES